MDYKVSNEDRLFIYLWYEIGNEAEPTLGQHWVWAGVEPISDTLKRIRGSMDKFKYKWDDGKIGVARIWDVSEYAKSKDMFHNKSKVDDSIRFSPTIAPTVKDTGKEVHCVHYSILEGLVNDYLHSVGQPLPVCELPTEPYEKIVEIISALKSDKKKILAQLPPRFWKTLTEGFISLEMEWDLTIVATYVKNVFGSFKNQLKAYEQFSDTIIVDCDNSDYQEKINNALSSGKKVLTLLSLCPGSNRDDRCKFLYSLCSDSTRGTIIEEADMGAWKKGQVDVLKKYQSSNEVVILTTGTDGDKAVALWDIDFLTECTYIDLLVNKELAKQKLGYV